LAATDFSISGPRVNLGGYNPILLILEAYNLKTYQVSAAAQDLPLYDSYYEITAIAPGARILTRNESRQMLQSLLADRFQLKFHREKRDMQVYELVVGKNGSKMKDSAPDAASGGGNVRVAGRNYEVAVPKADMNAVVQAITNSFLDRPVLDKTGLTGAYNLKLTYTPETQANRNTAPDASDISIFTAVQEQLGLKLEPKKATVEVLIVDRIENPTEN
jgi:uncharacterized protein (TIGR03435 family)